MSTCAVVRSVIESKMSEVQTSNVGFTSEVSDYLVVHTGPDPSLEYAWHVAETLNNQQQHFFSKMV